MNNVREVCVTFMILRGKLLFDIAAGETKKGFLLLSENPLLNFVLRLKLNQPNLYLYL